MANQATHIYVNDLFYHPAGPPSQPIHQLQQHDVIHIYLPTTPENNNSPQRLTMSQNDPWEMVFTTQLNTYR